MKRLVSIAIIVVLLALCACSPAKRIVGEWKTQSTVLGVVVETTYVFDENGTGKKCGAAEIPFTYEVQDNKLLITTSIIGVDVSKKEYSIDFKGNTIILTDENEVCCNIVRIAYRCRKFQLQHVLQSLAVRIAYISDIANDRRNKAFCC